MKVLVVGSGGREHAICWKIAKSDKVEKIYCAPGNAGIAWDCRIMLILVQWIFDKLVSFAKDKKIDLTVVGMDDPLGAVLLMCLKKRGLRVLDLEKMQRYWKALKHFLRT